jgi:hypothetical protein
MRPSPEGPAREHRSSTSPSTLPTTSGPSCSPPLQAGVLEGAASAGAKLVAMENLYMYGPTQGRPLTEDLPHAPNTRKGRVRARIPKS